MGDLESRQDKAACFCDWMILKNRFQTGTDFLYGAYNFRTLQPTYLRLQMALAYDCVGLGTENVKTNFSHLIFAVEERYKVLKMKICLPSSFL